MIKYLTTILFFLLAGFLSTLFSQIEIDGTIKVGDPSQLLLLESQKGDQLIGSVAEWEKDTLVFLMTTGNELVFAISEIKKISIYENSSVPREIDYSQGEFTFYAKDNSIRKGQLLMMNKQGARIKHRKNRRAYIRSYDLERATFSEEGHYGINDNNYKIKLDNGKSFHGQLIGIDKGYVFFKPYGQDAFKFSRGEITGIYKKKDFRPVTGHQRTLLITPTGFNLRKGEAEFRNVDYFLNSSYSKGLSDNISFTVGVVTIEPYVQMKFSKDFGKYFHLSTGGGITLTGAGGGFASLSVGTPDYFLNMGYMKNKGSFVLGDMDMDAIYFGGSFRIGNRQRIIAEMAHVSDQRSLLDLNNYGTNTFAFAYGWFGRRVSLSVGLLMAEETTRDFCFTPAFGVFPCNEENYFYNAYPVISTSIFFGDLYKKKN